MLTKFEIEFMTKRFTGLRSPVRLLLNQQEETRAGISHDHHLYQHEQSTTPSLSLVVLSPMSNIGSTQSPPPASLTYCTCVRCHYQRVLRWAPVSQQWTRSPGSPSILLVGQVFYPLSSSSFASSTSIVVIIKI